MSWLKDILEENRKAVDSWPAWEKVRWGMVNFSDREARAEIEKLNRALAEKDALIKRLKETTWNENVRLLAESKENLLQQFCNLQILYGAQKHQIRDKDKEIAYLRQKVQDLLKGRP